MSADSLWRSSVGGTDLRHPYLPPLHAEDFAGLPPALIIAPLDHACRA